MEKRGTHVFIIVVYGLLASVIMGVNFEKVGLIYGTLAYHLHLLTMQVLPGDSGNSIFSRYEAMQAFLIIAYLLHLAGFILLILKHFSLLSNKMADIATIVLFFAAAACTIIGIAIHGNIYGDGVSSGNVGYFQRASYVMGALAAIVAGVFLVLPFCGVGSK